jgi:nucleoside phosphorylase
MIFLVVAMACEARPLIDRYRLRAVAGARGFRVYAGTDCTLVVTGIGKLPTAAACGYLYGLLRGEEAVAWLNVGIGGHRDRGLGECVLAHKVRDATTHRCWYPPMLLGWSGATAEVVTVEAPELAYPEAVVYEMEASAFHAAATRFSTAELVQTVKVISDNPESPPQGLDADRVRELVSAALTDIDDLVGQLSTLAREVADWNSEPSHYRELLARCHFTVARRHRLQRLLEQLQVLYAGSCDWLDDLPSDDASGLLAALEALVSAAPIRVAGR